MAKKTDHFVLVHGFCRGAWCWCKLIPLLKSLGHRVTALDMSGCGADPKRFDQITSFSDYIQPLMEFMESLPQQEKVVLVGHSFGAMAISLAMESFPEKILVAIYVAAIVPNSESSPAALRQEDLELAKMMVRLSGLLFEDLAKESLLIEEKFGSVERVLVLAEKDGGLEQDLHSWIIENGKIKEVELILGADHMAMLLKPQELCLCLQKSVEKQC